jgi:anaerobic ribonucleoside-triphosphate reductase activating protein
MGGNPKEINELAKAIFHIDFCNHTYKIGWYWGGTNVPEEIELELFDFIKLGPYIKEKGGLDNPNTNQRFYHIRDGVLVDWTYKFWKHGNK